MALPMTRKTKKRGDDPWMQSESDSEIIEDDASFFNLHSMMQADTGFSNCGGNANFSSINANIFLMQAPLGIDSTPRAFLNHVDNAVANGNEPRTPTYANTPRGEMAMEPDHTLLGSFFQPTESVIQPRNLLAHPLSAAEIQDEPEYVTDSRTVHVSKKARKTPNPNPNPKPQVWKSRMPEIHELYVENNYTLEVTKNIMAAQGFHAEPWMYKKKFSEWGWQTYEKDNKKPAKRARGKELKEYPPNDSLGAFAATPSTPSYLAHVLAQSTGSNYTFSDSTTRSPSALYPAKFTDTQSNLILSREGTLQPTKPHSPALASFKTPYKYPTNVISTHSKTRIPTLMGNTDFDKQMWLMIENTKNLYISYTSQDKWMVKNQREVEEDIHDDLLVGVAASVRNYNSLSRKAGGAGFQKALQTLNKVIGTEVGADCGLFSLPAIWVSFVRLIREKRFDWAQELLSTALYLARFKFGPKHSFVQALSKLQVVWAMEPNQVEKVVLTAYLNFIKYVRGTLDSCNLTYIQLWADYVVYVDGSSTNDTIKVVKDIRSLIAKTEKGTRLDDGPDSEYIFELFGMMLYVLQSAPKDPIMAAEAEKVAKELLLRVQRRRDSAGGKLDEDMFITWKDLKQTLGTLCRDRKEYVEAIGYLEEFLNFEIVDDRDALALEKLEGCYIAIGKHEKAEEVRQFRKREVEKQFPKTDTEPAEGEEVAVNLEEEESSDGTVIGQVEEIVEEVLEECDAAEIEDAEAERQLLREQIAALEKRLNGLDKGKKRKVERM